MFVALTPWESIEKFGKIERKYGINRWKEHVRDIGRNIMIFL